MFLISKKSAFLLPKQRRRGATRRCCLLGLLTLLSSVPLQAKEEGLARVVLQLKWTHQFQFAGYYMAQHNGYYRDAGLEVEIREGSPTLDVTEEVLSGEADFGVGTSSLLLDYAAGKPVVVLGVIYQHSPLVLIMRANSPSSTLENLIGCPIMIEANSGDLLAMFRRAGLPHAPLNIIDHPSNAVDILNKKTCAISAYLTDEPYTLDRMGIPYFTFSPRTYGVDFYGDNFFTTQEMAKRNKGLVKRFRAATLRGWKEALRDPEKAIDLILAEYPNHKNREHLRYEARITQDLMTKLVSVGYMLPARWEHIADTYLETGMLEKRPDLKGFIFKTRPDTLPKWFWTSTLGGFSLVLLLASISIYLRILNLRLQREVARRQLAEEHLKTTNRELKAAKETAEEASRKKTWFIAHVSHDLRAPISAIVSLAHIFQHHSKNLALPDKFDRFLKQLHSSTEFLMLMLNNILDLSAFEMDAVSVNTERIDLDECCADIANLVQPLADEKEIGINVQIQATQKTVEMDRTRLSQILLNLLHNAIKFSPKGGTIFLDVALHSDRFKIAIRDQGPGIPPEKRKQVFEIFSKGDEGTSKSPGTGLGLSIVKRNVELLNGSVQVEQAQPTGAVFTVALPLNPDRSSCS